MAKKNQNISNLKPGIYIATHYNHTEGLPQNRLFFYNGKSLEQVLAGFCESEMGLSSMCFHKGDLYGCAGNGVYNLSKDPEGKSPIATRIGPDKFTPYSGALCIHNGILLDASGKSIFETLKDPRGKNSIIPPTDEEIKAICSHEGDLHYATGQNIYSNNKTSPFSASREYSVTSLCSHDRKLYDESKFGDIYDTISGAQIKSRDLGNTDDEYALDNVKFFGLCSHNGRLYDFGESYLNDALRDKKLIPISTAHELPGKFEKMNKKKGKSSAQVLYETRAYENATAMCTLE